MPTIKFYGHACFAVETEDVSLLIDPFFSGNPEIGSIPADLRPPTMILVSHNHRDHVGDAVELSRRFGAPIVATWAATGHYKGEGATVEPVHLGGRLKFDWGSIKCVPAMHDSPLVIGESWRVDLGAPCGFVIHLDGTSIYHAGDTALFGDMALFSPVDVALLPIDGRMVMEPVDAVRAAEFLKAGLVIPMHWRTEDPHEFVRMLEARGIPGYVMAANEVRNL